MKNKQNVLLSVCLLLLTASEFTASEKMEIKLISDLSIGADSGDENTIFGGIGDLALDSEENLYIFDSKNLQVR